LTAAGDACPEGVDGTHFPSSPGRGGFTTVDDGAGEGVDEDDGEDVAPDGDPDGGLRDGGPGDALPDGGLDGVLPGDEPLADGASPLRVGEGVGAPPA
jgi:hypothetical protein